MENEILWSGRPNTKINLLKVEWGYLFLTVFLFLVALSFIVLSILYRDLGWIFATAAALFFGYVLLHRLWLEPKLRASLTYHIYRDSILVLRDDGDKSVISFKGISTFDMESDDLKVGTILINKPKHPYGNWRQTAAVNPWLQLRCVENPIEVHRIAKNALASFKVKSG